MDPFKKHCYHKESPLLFNHIYVKEHLNALSKSKVPKFLFGFFFLFYYGFVSYFYISTGSVFLRGTPTVTPITSPCVHFWLQACNLFLSLISRSIP